MKKIVIGARGSKLSLTYVDKVKKLISKVADVYIEIKKIKTSGDIETSKKLSEIGGKKLFCKEIEENLRKLSSLSSVHRAFVRNTARYATPSTYDKQGRINLTPSLINFASLEKDVLIIGMVNKMEIWDPVQLEKADKKIEKINPEEYDALSDRIIL